MKLVRVVRGGFLNPFELQNYYPLVEKYDLRAISSLHPISEDVQIPITKTFSITDLPNFPYKFPILNRLSVDAHYLLGLEQILKGVDIAHVAETYFHYTIQAIKAKKKGYIKKIVSTVWENIPHNNEGIWGRKKFKRLAYEHIDMFIAVTQMAKNALVAEGVDPNKIAVIPMGVDVGRFKPNGAKRPVGIANNILCVARLTKEKGILDLVTAFNNLITKYPELKLTLIGDGPLKADLIGQRGIEIKQVPYSQIHREYQKADIFCLPSIDTSTWKEQYGMALVEAMACGLPVVTTRAGAIPEVCGTSAIYVRQCDPNDLQSKLENLIENDSSGAIQKVKSLGQTLEKFDHRNTAVQIDDLYQKTLNS